MLNFISFKKIPRYDEYVPKAAGKLKQSTVSEKTLLSVVYFPACVSRIFGAYQNENIPDQATIIRDVLTRLDFNIIYPRRTENLCCGMAFASKGFFQQGNQKAEELLNELFFASEYGKHPVLFDTSPCAFHLKDFINRQSNKQFSTLQIYDPVEFLSEFIMNKIELNKYDGCTAFHTPCSAYKNGLDERFMEIANSLSKNVYTLSEYNCCGFAGDKGFFIPELNASALSELKIDSIEKCIGGYSTSRMCEIGLSRHSGIYFKSIFYLIEKTINRSAGRENKE